MMKPGVASYDKFKEMFDRFSREAGKEQYLIPYFIAAHPGTPTKTCSHSAQWLKHNGFRLDQVQTFLPTPLRTRDRMYHTNKNPLRQSDRDVEQVKIIRVDATPPHKAFLRYHDAENWPLLREALIRMGRTISSATAQTPPRARIPSPSERVPARNQPVRRSDHPRTPAVYRKLAPRRNGAVSRGFDADRGNFQRELSSFNNPTRKHLAADQAHLEEARQCLTREISNYPAAPPCVRHRL